MKWLTIGWWSYLLHRDKYSGESRWDCFWCRMKNHPDGIIYYNSGGLEPDYTCRKCGDNLG